jgi:nucleoside-diphosphate-sugar epimerase
MRVFVAGGSGVLGRRVVGRLLEAGHDVTASAGGDAAVGVLRGLGARPARVDLFDPMALRGAVNRCDAALRLTTRIPPLTQMRRAAAWKETGRLRNQGARALADACVAESVQVLIHESVSFVYADGGDGWLDEGAPVNDGESAPLRDALTGEANARIVTAAGGRGIVLRYGGFYSADSVQSRTMANMLRRRRFTLLGPSNNYFSSIHVDDAAIATVAALQAPAGVYNVADNAPMRLRDYMAAFAEAVGAPPPRRLPAMLGPVVMGETWKYLPRSQRVSSQRLREATGWTAAVPDARAGWRLIAAQWAE